MKPSVTIRLDENLLARIDYLADSWKYSRSAMIEMLIERSLPEIEELTDLLTKAYGSSDEAGKEPSEYE